MARYRFVLADGQTFESSSTPAKILKTYPDARITHTVVTHEATGESALHPYRGAQEEASPAEPGPYEGKTVVDLLAIARERDIDVPTSSRKAEVIAALEADDEAATSDQQGEG